MFGYRYIPLIDGCENLPVISTVRRTTISCDAALEIVMRQSSFYGERKKLSFDVLPRVPVQAGIIKN